MSPDNLQHIPHKAVGTRVYTHVSNLGDVEPLVQETVATAERCIGLIQKQDYNVLRLDTSDARIGLLSYSDFFETPFPALAKSWVFDPEPAAFVFRSYEHSLNPPILHRKELLLSIDHPRREEFAILTREAESIGLFDEPTRIGFQQQWLKLIRDKGYRLIDDRFVPIGNDEACGDEEAPLFGDWSSARQSTALSRTDLSAPIQTLMRHGYLDGSHTIFDYGCGRGGDLEQLRNLNIEASGWDPYYSPDSDIATADIVNIGFVVNVIEQTQERQDALINAFSLARRLLVVAVMLQNSGRPMGREFNDGILTGRGTFQKYYTQAEFKAFVETTLHEEAVPVAPGIVYVFRDKSDERRFLGARYHSRRALVGRTTKSKSRISAHRQRQYQEYQGELEALWALWLSLGRKPSSDEVDDVDRLVDGFGSLSKALTFVKRSKDGEALLTESARRRQTEIEVQLALTQFEQRLVSYKNLDERLRRDVKALFGTLKAARDSAHALLYRIADTEEIEQACRESAQYGLGWLVSGEYLQVHVSLIEQLPPVLRVYVGCASVLYGDYREADLVKIHIASGKISLMRFDAFDGNPLPKMVERVKIKLREQDIEYYSYGDEFESPYLYYKSRYINEEHPDYSEQLDFDEKLRELGLFYENGYGPPPTEFKTRLAHRRYAVKGFNLARTQTIPRLTERCGRYLTYQDLIECGETQSRTQFANLPRKPESYTALSDLANEVLDPVIDYYGMVRLTFGFCSLELAKEIPGRIAPRLDQHASHEVNTRSNYICNRLGAAVDFIVDDEDMLEVAKWIATNTPFDRMYFYGERRPIHVSCGPNRGGLIVHMKRQKGGRVMPYKVPRKVFLQLNKA